MSVEKIKSNNEDVNQNQKPVMTEERMQELSQKFDLPQEIYIPEDNQLPDLPQHFYFSEEDFKNNLPEKGETYQIGNGPVMGYNPDLPPAPSEEETRQNIVT